MDYQHKFTLTISPLFKELIKAVESSPQDSPQRDRAKQALGQYVYRMWDDYVNDEDDPINDTPDEAQERMKHIQDAIDAAGDNDEWDPEGYDHYEFDDDQDGES